MASPEKQKTVNPTTGKVFRTESTSIEPGINFVGHMINKLGGAGTVYREWVTED